MSPQSIEDKPMRSLAVALIFLIGSTGLAFAQQIGTQEDAARIITIQNLSTQDGAVSGEIHNRSARTVRAVELLVRHTWLWNEEFKPGKDDPGTSAYYTVPGEVPPGGTARFKFTPDPPLPKRSNGEFVTSVSIAGYTEVIPVSR